LARRVDALVRSADRRLDVEDFTQLSERAVAGSVWIVRSRSPIDLADPGADRILADHVVEQQEDSTGHQLVIVLSHAADRECQVGLPEP